MINETLSFESTLESPTKPTQEKSSSQKKLIFLVHYMNDNQRNEKIDKNGPKQITSKYKNRRKSKRGRMPKKLNKMIKIKNNMLDFDMLLSTLFENEKKENDSGPKKKYIIRRKHQQKLIGIKRKRQIKETKYKSKQK